MWAQNIFTLVQNLKLHQFTNINRKLHYKVCMEAFQSDNESYECGVISKAGDVLTSALNLQYCTKCQIHPLRCSKTYLFSLFVKVRLTFQIFLFEFHNSNRFSLLQQNL